MDTQVFINDDGDATIVTGDASLLPSEDYRVIPLKQYAESMGINFDTVDEIIVALTEMPPTE